MNSRACYINPIKNLLLPNTPCTLLPIIYKHVNNCLSKHSVGQCKYREVATWINPQPQYPTLTMVNHLTCVKCLAASLAIVLAITDFNSFFLERPTGAQVSSEPVTQEHFPDLVLCPSPGYDLTELEKRGFQGFDGYLVGIVNDDEFRLNLGGSLMMILPTYQESLLMWKSWRILLLL